MERYSADIEGQMKTFYESLSEKDRRRYAAVEVQKLGYGGTAYVASVLNCDAKTIRQGQADMAELPEDPAAMRVRKKGGTQMLS